MLIWAVRWTVRRWRKDTVEFVEVARSFEWRLEVGGKVFVDGFTGVDVHRRLVC